MSRLRNIATSSSDMMSRVTFRNAVCPRRARSRFALTARQARRFAASLAGRSAPPATPEAAGPSRQKSASAAAAAALGMRWPTPMVTLPSMSRYICGTGHSCSSKWRISVSIIDQAVERPWRGHADGAAGGAADEAVGGAPHQDAAALLEVVGPAGEIGGDQPGGDRLGRHLDFHPCHPCHPRHGRAAAGRRRDAFFQLEQRSVAGVRHRSRPSLVRN